jgi:hypothetical protein
MMLSSGTELIELAHDVNYAPTFVSTDRRVPPGEKTSLGYYQIGETQQWGFARGPIFKMEVVSLAGVGSPTHMKIWGIDNLNDDAPIYPLTYFSSASAAKNTIEVYLKKFIFCNSVGEIVAPSDYTIVGYKKRAMPIAW